MQTMTMVQSVKSEQEPSQQVVTFLYVRLNEIPGSETDGTDLAAELVAYQQVIEEVAAEFQGLTRLISADTALLLFSSSPGEEAPARGGVHAAVALRSRLETLNRQRREGHQRPFRIGIGVHTNSLSSGQEQERLLDLHRNIQHAEGLSLLNRQAPFPAIFVSQSAFQGLGGTNGYQIQNLGEAFVPNLKRALTVYALMHGASSS